MTSMLLLPELRSMLAENDREGLTALMTELHPATVADWTEGLSVEETWKVFEHAGIDRQAEVFGFFPIGKQVEMATAEGASRRRWAMSSVNAAARGAVAAAAIGATS